VKAETKTDSNGRTTAEIDHKTITEAVDSALKSFKSAVGEIRLNVKNTGSKKAVSAELSIKSESLKYIAQNKNIVLTIETDLGAITLDSTALAGLTADADDGEEVIVYIQSVKKKQLDANQQKLAGNNPVIDFSITISGKAVREFKSKVKITVPYEAPKGFAIADYDLLTVYHMGENGGIAEMNSAEYDGETKIIAFTTAHFSKFFIGEWINPFSDIKKDDWYYRIMRFAYGNALMNGVSADKFDPNGNLTKAMLVTILYRYDGKPAVENNVKFADVEAGQWYTEAVNWAAANNITGANDSGLFGVNDIVTYEQLAVMLYNYSRHKKYDVSKTSDLSEFTDADEISEGAVTAVKWAYAEEFIKGRTIVSIAPKRKATRIETAEMLKKYAESLEDSEDSAE
jgi:hypothetical protein